MKERVQRDASASASASASARVQEREKIVVGGKEGAHWRQVFIPEPTEICFELQTWHAHRHVTIDEERINRSYGASPSATSRHVNCAPYFKLRLSSNKNLLILVSKFRSPQHSFLRLGLLPSACVALTRAAHTSAQGTAYCQTCTLTSSRLVTLIISASFIFKYHNTYICNLTMPYYTFVTTAATVHICTTTRICPQNILMP